MERFYDPVGGEVKLDGHDLRDLNVHWLRQQIGLVSQEPALFACSIRENIAYGSPNATQEQIEEAARKANAHSFIVSFPDGYNTQVRNRKFSLAFSFYVVSQMLKLCSPFLSMKQVGYKGTQLSGGMHIFSVLHPRVLVLVISRRKIDSFFAVPQFNRPKAANRLGKSSREAASDHVA